MDLLINITTKRNPIRRQYINAVPDLPKQPIPKRVGSSDVNDMTSNDLLGLKPDL